MPALALLVFVSYWQTLDQGFHFDDDNTIVHNPAIRQPVQWLDLWSDPEAFSRTPGAGMYRPLLLSTFAINHAWSGDRGWSWHLVNLALHPVCVEPVSYISSRSELMSTAMLLVCLVTYIRSRELKGGWPDELLSYLALAAGLLCKATMVAAQFSYLSMSSSSTGKVRYRLHVGWRHPWRSSV